LALLHQLHLISEEIDLKNSQGQGYSIKMLVKYHPIIEEIVEVSDWVKIENNIFQSPLIFTKYSYDNFGRMTEKYFPGDPHNRPTTIFSYFLRTDSSKSPFSRLVKKVRTQNSSYYDSSQITCFNGLGQQVQIKTQISPSNYQVDGYKFYSKNGKEYISHQPYISNGSECDLLNPNTPFTKNLYDFAGRVIKTEKSADKSYLSTFYFPFKKVNYDEEDNNSSGPHYNTPTIIYSNGLSKQIKIEQSLTRTKTIPTRFSYDPLGSFKELTNSKGHKKQNLTDLLGRVIEIKDPNYGTLKLSYDDAGNKSWDLDPKGIKTRYQYDSAKRILNSWKDGEKEKTITRYFYDQPPSSGLKAKGSYVGKLYKVTYPNGMDSYQYNNRGLVEKRTREINGKSFSFKYLYDNSGKILKTIFPNDRRIENVYDLSGRISEIPGYISKIEYDEKGLLNSIKFNNGTEEKLSYDDLLRLNKINVNNVTNNKILDLSYSFDKAGNIVTIKDGLTLAGDKDSGNAQIKIDSLYRLKSAHVGIDGSNEEKLEYEYDEIDNLIEKNSDKKAKSKAHIGSLKYGENSFGPNMLTSAGGIQLEYDKAGNLTLKGQKAFEWDYLGRLIKIKLGNKTLSENFYDFSKSRIRKKGISGESYYITPEFEIRNGKTRIYLNISGK